MLHSTHLCGQEAGKRGGHGFTLAEMMVVVAIIALLVAILMPTLNGAFARAKDSLCRNNLHHIAQTLHADVHSIGSVTTGSSWLGVAMANADFSKDMVWCQADTRSRANYTNDSIMAALKDVYNLQFEFSTLDQYACSFLPDIFAGKKVPDNQVWAIYPRGGINQPPKSPWNPLPTPREDQAFIGTDNDAGVMITFRGDSILFESVVPPDSVGYSRQFIVKGQGKPPCPMQMGQLPNNDTETCIIHLWGTDYKQLAPAASINMGTLTSYGINGLVEEKDWRPDQIFLMDANQLVVNPLSTNKADFLDQVLIPRHNGKLNVAACDGSVRQTTEIDMEMQLNRSPNLWKGTR